MNAGLELHEEESRRIDEICGRLLREAGARVVFLVDRAGQLLASVGESRDVDTTSLASLAAGNVAAMGGLAKLIGEGEFPSQFHEGARESLHISIVGGRVVLVVIFDSRATPLGIVRLRVKKSSEELARVLDDLSRRPVAAGGEDPLAEITDADIDNLFGD